MEDETNFDRDFFEEVQGLEKLLEHRSRFAVLVLLARHQEMNFRRLKDLLQETDGNLGAHLRKLEDHAFIEVRKAFEKRKPISWYALTSLGRDALTGHVAALRTLTANLDPPSA